MCRFVLLGDEERLALCAVARLVVGREREKDDESGEDRESAREDPEDARCTVAVLEVAALGSATPDEEHCSDRDRRHGESDHEGPQEIHGATLLRLEREPSSQPCPGSARLSAVSGALELPSPA